MQMDLFPRATAADKGEAKEKLSYYRRNKKIVVESERKGIDKLDAKQQLRYNTAVKDVEDIELAVRMIIDAEIREMIEYKYIVGDRRRHIDTLARFNTWEQSTVGRKLNEGIESIAESMLLFP